MNTRHQKERLIAAIKDAMEPRWQEIKDKSSSRFSTRRTEFKTIESIVCAAIEGAPDDIFNDEVSVQKLQERLEKLELSANAQPQALPSAAKAPQARIHYMTEKEMNEYGVSADIDVMKEGKTYVICALGKRSYRPKKEGDLRLYFKYYDINDADKVVRLSRAGPNLEKAIKYEENEDREQIKLRIMRYKTNISKNNRMDLVFEFQPWE